MPAAIVISNLSLLVNLLSDAMEQAWLWPLFSFLQELWPSKYNWLLASMREADTSITSSPQYKQLVRVYISLTIAFR